MLHPPQAPFHSRLQTSTVLGEFHKQLLQVPLHLHLLLPRELQPLPEVHPYFSVEHTVSPQLAVSNSSSECSVEFTVHNLMRCVSYQSTATSLLSNERGNSIVVGDTVMRSEGVQLI